MGYVLNDAMHNFYAESSFLVLRAGTCDIKHVWLVTLSPQATVANEAKFLWGYIKV